MLHEFSRAELLLGAQAIQTLAASHVAVFGVGGVGSFACEALARAGVGEMTLIDNDTVALTNRNRQLIALASTSGQPKVDAMCARIADINPRCTVHALRMFYTPDSALDLTHFDYVIDAIDTVTAKLALIVYAQSHDIPIVASMGTGNKLHPELFQISDIYKTSVCPLCKVMRRELQARQVKKLTVCWSPELPLTPGPTEEDTGARRATPGSIAFVPPAAGLLIAGKIVRDLCGLE